MKTRYRVISPSAAVYGRVRPITNRDMLTVFGVQGTKWPDQGMDIRTLPCIERRWSETLGIWEDTGTVGLQVFVNPKPASTGRKSSKHRVWCWCPGCGRMMSMGRLAQHVCKA